MNTKEILNELYSHEYKGWRLGLDNVKVLLEKIGNPEKKLKCIHVAGTNGKGSVCAFIASILKESGYKVGLYTSPHLVRFNERIQINGIEISDKNIAGLYQEIKPHITEQTFFEITTAMAFLYFSREKVDFAVLEVGLGGRLDATNVVTPLVSIITSISIEHTQILGKTIEKIAYEKAGIIKQGIPVVAGCKGKALDVISEISDEKKAQVYLPEKVKYQISLNGKFQNQNAGIALAAIKILRDKYKIKILDENIQRGFLKTKWRARLEFVENNIVVDCAHNPDGIKALIHEIKHMKKKHGYQKLVFLVGILKDKDIRQIISQIGKAADIIVITKPESMRAEEPETIAGIAGNNSISMKKIFVEKDIQKAISIAKKQSSENDLIIICGSIYLAGAAIGILKRC